MESGDKLLPSRGLKQVKVDNWGTFFLQRLQQIYADEELFDLKIRFPTSEITVQAHRLVVSVCTDYFVKLENQQKEKNENYDGIIIMPSDMPYECVKSIISFMYTGQLEYWTSEQHALYRTAQKMNMTVLTKLLDAQFNTSTLQNEPTKTVRPVAAVSKPSISPAKVTTSSTSSTLPEQPLPGRKLPIWKRKIEESPATNYELRTFHSTPSLSRPMETTPGPSRFDLPEADEIALGVFSSFDDITYNTKPIVQASDIYKTGSSFRKRSPDRDSKNDTTEDEDDDSPGNDKGLRDTNSDDDWSISKSFSRSQDGSAKKVRFDLEEKENLEKPKSNTRPSSEDSINNHAKIIREVLKKYPHLVKNNKNIRLKIMQKEAKSSDSNAACKTKVSYVVLKSDHLLSSNNGDENESKCNGSIDGNETGPWKCNKCDLEEEYTNYYMYRRHMQDVHEEKFDPRVCEHCGYKATKRNILMYHLYTKHNVPPPKSLCFPKCQSCSYVALSENLLVRHQINHNHRPSTRHHPLPAEDVQCGQCNQSFRTITELTTHQLSTGHDGVTDNKEKGHRCPYCGKMFVLITNLQVHLDCNHKEMRDTESTTSAPPISLEPSSEAEALSHVASGIAASLGVGDTVTAEVQESSSNNQYIVPDMQLENITHNINYNEHKLEGQHMIMLVDNENYQHVENDHQQQQPQQLDIADNEQIVMQGTEDGMIVYIHGAKDSERRTYDSYQSDDVSQEETEEIVEEVVEEVEEEVMEEEEIQEIPQDMLEECGDNQVEEVIQYVEEQTEIVEYDEEQCSEQSNTTGETHESVMIIEEEHVEGEEDIDKSASKRRKKVRSFATDWDEDSMSMTES
ncbi:centrosome-associated zinc finger protein CP190 [Harpegnathos saltator]|uniref:Centrosome-associated zinc finger protein CP190 n=1 Tax=Harpegnathos saltator TaxID=610380 RepID=E2BN36_HARSA|nr:centrosome-associated zinc finger protein CP190 [Harpegnathos saltator]XP_011141913.1 centrosome-associated zinc finger protein CP190 [Harpegnathos saltator]XP_019697655.1 centrosome-associated zinc finger protein CP190 [Harpegnathos saltator]XP_025158203.1 centrosome-associated zinc finger protein CP190 [Harpegnathos saltator]EFN82940.1 Centrosome-associated zinc finger protein CP190 [Harpegnathos saltator]